MAEDTTTATADKGADTGSSSDTGTSSSSTSSKKSKASATSGNCTGELKQQPYEAGVTYQKYKCESCGQIVTVSAEDLTLNGLPTEHSPTLPGE